MIVALVLLATLLLVAAVDRKDHPTAAFLLVVIGCGLWLICFRLIRWAM